MDAPLSRFVAVVELHILHDPPLVIRDVSGDVRRVTGTSELGERVEPGTLIGLGDVVYLPPEARLCSGTVVVEGKKGGRAHSFVHEAAVVSSPSRADVPHLLKDLEKLERQMLSQLGEDAFLLSQAEPSFLERAFSAEFALLNLECDAARELPETVARRAGAVCLFFAGDTACVAFSRISLANIRTAMETLGRPINPHRVSEATLRVLLDTVYGLPTRSSE